MVLVAGRICHCTFEGVSSARLEPHQRAGVVHVVFVGGSCSGKTTMAAGVAERLRARGVRVMVVAKGASAAMSNGLGDIPTMDPARYDLVQAELGVSMHLAGVAAHRLVKAAGGGVVLHDRGALDAYVHAATLTIDDALAEVGTSRTAVLEGFDMVVVLEPAGYETESNRFRYEDRETVARRGTQLAQVWSAHRHVVTVGVFSSPAERATAIVSEIDRLLSPT